jgi:hypothetical protein
MSCHSNNASPEERARFEKACSATDSTTNITVDFIGFRDEEFDSVLVREYSDTVFVDSFMLYVAPAQTADERRNLHRTATINEWLQLDRSYHFCTPSRKPFVLSKMKLITVSYRLTPDSLDCLMGDYLLDGERCENLNLRFIK